MIVLVYTDGRAVYSTVCQLIVHVHLLVVVV